MNSVKTKITRQADDFF